MMKRSIIISMALIAIAIVGYFVYRRYLVTTIVKEAAIDEESLANYTLPKLKALLTAIRKSSERPAAS